MYKILVVDDEENIREVIREYAEFEGHEVDEACDGMEAVEKAKEKDYDIILRARKSASSSRLPYLCSRRAVKNTTSCSALSWELTIMS